MLDVKTHVKYIKKPSSTSHSKKWRRMMLWIMMINEYEQVIHIFKTLSDSSIKKYTDCFHFVVHYLTFFPEKTRNEYSILYKKNKRCSQ